ncbi:MAG: phosphoglycerate kinase [Candidatus Vogelbacteria bacterium CG10_big_fil_rev_8_21_14_0_10_51_16]|uniref:Phosphoglycerate kinase n=1 Tax=Candidatus Vogelbacteria bacterium CG10_big_fil_rev_8_21_14_0_10_51_16 TaxID=1975045 RepID=A0A2H0RF20_9BACT|nr:MAG: phosphoglycerate kinase [Candidatus Vogelbacteria bacterium CG10_big_fil_rev_8_21_14_0_10_51_16]
MELPFIKNFEQFAGKRVFLRACLNAPMENGKLTNSFRLRRLQPTIQALREVGAKVILAGYLSHEVTCGFKPVAEFLGVELLDTLDPRQLQERAGRLGSGEVVMLPNLRRDPREEKNDLTFAHELASLADVYVNDAFPDSHREYSSIIGIPRLLPSLLGPQFQLEIEHLSKAFSPAHPFLFILGGAKFSTKEPLVSGFLESADHIFITGALANTFFKAKGYEVGTSLIEPDEVVCPKTGPEALLPDAFGPPRRACFRGDYQRLRDLMENKKILLPIDVTVQGLRGSCVKKPDAVLPDENMLDVGPATVAMVKELIGPSQFVLWNGPLGNFEKGFSSSTDEVALALAISHATSIVGGGDTLAALNRLGLDEKRKDEGGFDFVSTAGGAMLDFLAHRSLPGIEAVKNARQ